MSLSQKQMDKAEAWLSRHMPDRTCPARRRGNQGFWHQLVTAPTLQGERGTIPPMLAFLVAQCDHCGHAMLFDAAKIGIIERR